MKYQKFRTLLTLVLLCLLLSKAQAQNIIQLNNEQPEIRTTELSFNENVPTLDGVQVTEGTNGQFTITGGTTGQTTTTTNNGQTTTTTVTTTITRISLLGRYRLIFSNSNLNTVQAEFTNNTITFSSCNTIQVTYEAFDNGTLNIGEPQVRGQATCQNPLDQAYVDALRSIDGIVITATVVTFTSQGATVITLGNIITTTVITITRVFIVGFYRLQFANLLLSPLSANFTNDSITFTSCADIRIPYRAFENGTFTAADAQILVQRFCSNSLDSAYIEAFKSIDGFRVVGNTIIFTSKGTTVITVDRGANGNNNTNGTVSAVSLAGGYQLQIVGSALPIINITLNANTLSFNLCNSNSAPYAAFSNGSFAFTSGFSQTRRACTVDNDSQYINALNTVNGWQLDTSTNILYLLRNGVRVIALLNPSENPTNSFSPVLSLGNAFQLQIIGSQLPIINITLSQTLFSFSLCNINSAPYIAYSNRTFVFTTAFTQTRRSCSVDNDTQYINALNSINGWEFDTSSNILYLLRNTVRVISLTPGGNGSNNNGNNDNSLKGSYIIIFANTQLPSLPANLTDNQIIYTACSTFSLPYSSLSNGSFSVSGQANVTAKTCPINIDTSYLNAFKNGTAWRRNGTTVYILRNEAIIMTLQPNNSTGNGTGNGSAVVLGGILQLIGVNLASIPAKVTGNTIQFKGCNLISIQYQSFISGTIRWYDATFLTQNKCTLDYDQRYIGALKNTNNYAITSNTYFFKNNGVNLVQIIHS